MYFWEYETRTGGAVGQDEPCGEWVRKPYPPSQERLDDQIISWMERPDGSQVGGDGNRGASGILDYVGRPLVQSTTPSNIAVGDARQHSNATVFASRCEDVQSKGAVSSAVAEILAQQLSDQAIQKLPSDQLEMIEEIMLGALPRLVQEMRRRRLENAECIVCRDQVRSVALLPCGHQCLCRSCSETQATLTKCPVCRAEVEGRVLIHCP